MRSGDKSPVAPPEAGSDGQDRFTRPDLSKRKSSNFDPIGAALRRLHDEIANEPLPGDFLKLIAEIDKKIEQGKG